MDNLVRSRAMAVEQAFATLIAELEARHAPPFTEAFIAEHGRTVNLVLAKAVAEDTR